LITKFDENQEKQKSQMKKLPPTMKNFEKKLQVQTFEKESLVNVEFQKVSFSKPPSYKENHFGKQKSTPPNFKRLTRSTPPNKHNSKSKEYFLQHI
jgi:hypothetical protein